MQMATLGYIGLGAMGGRVTKRLLDAGHTVIGYNRTKTKAQWLLDAGMQWADSPRAGAESADVVFTTGSNPNALHEVLGGPDGGLARLGTSKIYIDMRPSRPKPSRQLAEQ